MKKVLFINPENKLITDRVPHLGLAMLSAVLRRKGHEVLVIDYQHNPDSPNIEIFVDNFNPDVIGISLFTATINEASVLINKLTRYELPIMVGGPHASCYFEDLEHDHRIDYIVIGEAESIINKVVGEAKKERKPIIVSGDLPDPKLLPYPDFTTFYQYRNITKYPLMTSRGCPFNCSYCVVRLASSRKWRAREPRDCINELKYARKMLPNLDTVFIMDDNFTVDLERAKKFLTLYEVQKFNYTFRLANVRADLIDEEIIRMLKDVDCKTLGIGVEHGDPEVFKNIDKRESLEDIKRAAKLIKKYGIKLYCCFIIGLPGDSLEKTYKSIKLAKELGADYTFWNMLTPYKGSRVRDFFEKQGLSIDDIGHSTWRSGSVMPDEPCVGTPEFPKYEQKKAYLIAMLETRNYDVKKHFPVIKYALMYGAYKPLFYWIVEEAKDIFCHKVNSIRNHLQNVISKGR